MRLEDVAGGDESVTRATSQGAAAAAAHLRHDGS